ncbi:MAG TPA: hypothetical protein VL996_12010 [Methylocella sp.]|nr:hypothetical protein [Methylocella sp.]
MGVFLGEGEAQSQSKTASSCETAAGDPATWIGLRQIRRGGPLPPPSGKYKPLRALSHIILDLEPILKIFPKILDKRQAPTL